MVGTGTCCLALLSMPADWLSDNLHLHPEVRQDQLLVTSTTTQDMFHPPISRTEVVHVNHATNLPCIVVVDKIVLLASIKIGQFSIFELDLRGVVLANGAWSCLCLRMLLLVISQPALNRELCS